MILGKDLDNFDRHFEKTQKTINRHFETINRGFLFSALMACGGFVVLAAFVGTIIYLLLKNFG